MVQNCCLDLLFQKQVRAVCLELRIVMSRAGSIGD